jgi:DNA-binding LacI/PurR family transcriptional regulator
MGEPVASNGKVKAITLKMVAKAAGVSESAVCHILKGRAKSMGISAACETRVQAAARRLGYLGNYHARALALQTTHSIGLALASGPTPFLDEPYWSSLIAGIELEVRLNNYSLNLIGSTDLEDVLSRAYLQLMNKRIDALILFPYLYANIPKELFNPNLPIVFVEGRNLEKVSRVGLEPCSGIDAAVRHLKSLGHRTIHWIGKASGDDVILGERIHRCQEIAKQEGLGFEGIYLEAALPSPLLSQYGWVAHFYRILSQELTLPPKATAIICENDAVALVLLKVLNDRGFDVPRDISLIGFDDLFSRTTIPGITTISHRLNDIGRAAVTMALEKISGKGRKGATVELVEASLLVRDSTGPYRPRA